MARWIEPRDWQASSQVKSTLDLSELLLRLLDERGIKGEDKIRGFLYPDHYEPTPAQELPGITSGVEELRRAIKKGERIGVWGDFDVDGQTSTALLVSAIKNLEADVVYHIPVRETESHGIKVHYLKEFLHEGVRLLLTCDTGIAAHEAIDFASKEGVRVVITDHHDLPEFLPNAEAVVNPNFLPRSHPLATLPGVGVAYKLIEALYQEFGMGREVSKYQDLVALGIVADVAELMGDTRYLLQLGLKRLRETERVGLKALFERAEINPVLITEEEVGFVIAPRLNALGRLGDANPIVEFLTTESSSVADVTALRLEELNASRKLMSDQVFAGAMAEIKRFPELVRNGAIVLSNPFWPAGVVGIVASRLAERYRKPVVLLKVSEDGMARGSARSVEGCDISAAIHNCAFLLDGYGGHPMAAGMSLSTEKIGQFREKLSFEVERQLGKEVVEPDLVIDQYISLKELDLPLIREIRKLGPFGNGNPPVRFAVRGLSLVSHSYLGRDGEHRKLVVEDEAGERQSVLWWQSREENLPQGKFDLAFTARESYFRGDTQIQVVLEDIRQDECVQISVTEPDIQLVDHRVNIPGVDRFEEFISLDPDAQIWGEGEIPKKWQKIISNRLNLEPGHTLVVWSVPPDMKTMQTILRMVKPVKIVLFSNRPDTETRTTLIRRLAGLVKFVISKREGRTALRELAAECGQTELIVRLGLSWLEEKGYIGVETRDDGELKIVEGSSFYARNLSAGSLEEDLDGLLQESRLFRDYFISSDLDSLRDELKLSK